MNTLELLFGLTDVFADSGREVDTVNGAERKSPKNDNLMIARRVAPLHLRPAVGIRMNVLGIYLLDRDPLAIHETAKVKTVSEQADFHCPAIHVTAEEWSVLNSPKFAVVSHPYFFFCALRRAQRARCAAPILALAAALIVRGPLPLPVAFPPPAPFRNALACCSFAIC